MSVDPSFALFGALNPFFGAIDDLIGFVSPPLRVLAWGIVAAMASMLLYKAVSAQNRLERLAGQTSESRRKLKSMAPGDSGYRQLVVHTLRLNLSRLGLTLPAALLSAIPVIMIAVFLDARFSMNEPQAGQFAAVLADSGGDIQLDRGQALSQGWIFRWPDSADVVTIRDAAGLEILSIQPETQPGLAAKGDWMSFLFGAPAGRIVPESTVDSLVIATAPRDLLMANYLMPYQWTLPFFLALLAMSITMKFAMRIK